MSTNDVTPRSRALFEQLTVSQLLMKFQAFHGIRMFIIVFITAQHLFLCWTKFFHSKPSDPISLRSILILFSHLSLGHRGYQFSSSFATKTECIFCSSRTCHMPLTSQPTWFHHLSNICCGLQMTKPPITQFSPLSSYFHLGPISFLFTNPSASILSLICEVPHSH
jgi:hypothetical protein